MIEGLPAYVSPLFIATTFLTVGFLFYALKQVGTESLPARLLLFLVPFWLVFQTALGLGGFFTVTSTLPPRIFAFAAFPALLVAVLFVLLFREFIEKLPLRTITLLHVIRVPVEITLLMLYMNGQVPQTMTFEGRNFDILSGLSAPIIYFLAFHDGHARRSLLIVWNLICLCLLVNIVSIAVLTFPSPLQSISLGQPNRAVMYFPFVWLPAVVVPIVFFCHIAALKKLFSSSGNRSRV